MRNDGEDSMKESEIQVKALLWTVEYVDKRSRKHLNQMIDNNTQTVVVLPASSLTGKAAEANSFSKEPPSTDATLMAPSNFLYL